MKLGRNEYFKLTRPTGWDFYSGKTINYREALGRKVKAPRFEGELALCGPGVLHASKKPLDCFQGSRIPCSLFIIQGKPVLKSDSKCGFKELKVNREVPANKFAGIFAFNYEGAVTPLDPRKITPPTIDDRILKELSVWASVRASVGDSVWASVRASVWDSVRASVWDSVGASVWDSVRASVWDIEAAYLGTLFPTVKVWKYTDKLKVAGYPFQSCINLLKQGLIPAYHQKKKEWFLLGGPNLAILKTKFLEELRKYDKEAAAT